MTADDFIQAGKRLEQATKWCGTEGCIGDVAEQMIPQLATLASHMLELEHIAGCYTRHFDTEFELRQDIIKLRAQVSELTARLGAERRRSKGSLAALRRMMTQLRSYRRRR